MNAGIPVIADPKVTRHILNAFHLRASKRLGQNFLVDAGVVRAIVDAADLSPADTVLEIGPGIGTLTQGLAESGARVVAVELDKKLPAVLAETLKGYDNVTIVPGDILKLDILRILNLGAGEQFKVVVKKAAAPGEDAAVAVNQHFLLARPVFSQVNHGDASPE